MKKKRLAVVIGMLLGSTSAFGDPGLMLGIGYNFGGTVGVTAGVLSNDRADRPLALIGVSYFPLSTRQFGVTVCCGYMYRPGRFPSDEAVWDIHGPRSTPGSDAMQVRLHKNATTTPYIS